jgi:hypothetical protein
MALLPSRFALPVVSCSCFLPLNLVIMLSFFEGAVLPVLTTSRECKSTGNFARSHLCSGRITG